MKLIPTFLLCSLLLAGMLQPLGAWPTPVPHNRRSHLETRCLLDLASGHWNRLLTETSRLHPAKAPTAERSARSAVLLTLADLGQHRFGLARRSLRTVPAPYRTRVAAFARFARWHWYWHTLAPLWLVVYAALLLASLAFAVFRLYSEALSGPVMSSPSSGLPGVEKPIP